MTLRRTERLAVAIALLIAVLLVWSAPSQGATRPQRIVSLSPGVTEILYALNLGAEVAGDTDYCDYPPAAKLKPHIGDMVVNYELVIALRPDLVIADSAANRTAIPRLKALRLPLMIVASNTIGDVERNVETIAAATGAKTQAARVLASMNHALRLAAQIARSGGNRPSIRTLVTIGLDPLYVAGSSSFMGDMVTKGGGVNLAGSTAYIPWSKEQAVVSQPQAIFCEPADKEALLSDPAWKQTPAVRSGNVFVYSSSAYMRPGPRLAEAAVAVATDLARARR